MQIKNLKKPKTLEDAWNIILVLVDRIHELEAEVINLKGQINKNSSNSSKPPSSDGFFKPKLTKSQRIKSGKKPGAQNGHKGSTLKMVEIPDDIIRHTPQNCSHCQNPLFESPIVSTKRKQVFEIPPMKIHITEHQLNVVKCTKCHKETCASAPEGITSTVNYGYGLQSLALYMMNQQLMPYERLTEFFRDCLNITISKGTLFSIQQRGCDNLEPINQEIKKALISSGVVHFDESGIRCDGALHWLHVASSSLLTSYDVHARRGKEAINDIGILPLFNGIAVHDHFKSYFDFLCKHALCNTHHLRELIFIAEEKHEIWAKDMKDLLREIYIAVDIYKKSGRKVAPDNVIKKFEAQYKIILNKGFAYHNKLPILPRTGKRGRLKQRPGKNFLDRLKKKQAETLLFLHDFSVPFTNNLAEQDIRMIKIKQKISGCFRTIYGAQMFCHLRGYISTSRKNGINILQALKLATINPPSLSSLLALAQ